MRKLGLLLLASGVVVTAVSFARADSFVRVVRLSWVNGAVQVNLADGNGWRPALLNSPLSEGEQVRTLGNGRAEIELEDGSTLRLIPSSELDFTKLRLLDAGSRVTTAALASGTVFVSTRKADSKDFQLTLPGGQTILPNGDASFRAGLAVDDPAHASAHVEVLAGKPSVLAPGAPGAPVTDVKLQKSDAVTLAPAAAPVVAKNTEPPDTWQQWSDNRDHWYQQGLSSGVAPASLDSYVNWYAETDAPNPPVYNGAMLAQNSSDTCAWSFQGGWCWSDTQGWFMPTLAAGLQVPGAFAGAPPAIGLLAGGGYGYGGYYDPCSGMYFGNPYSSFYGGGLGFGYGYGGWGGLGFSGLGCSPFDFGGYPFYGLAYPTVIVPLGGGVGTPGTVPTRPVLPVGHGLRPPPKYVPVAKPPIAAGPSFGVREGVAGEHLAGGGDRSISSPRFSSGPNRPGEGHFAGPPPSIGRLVGPPPSLSSGSRFEGPRTSGVSHGISASIGPPPGGSRFSAPVGRIASGGGGAASFGAARSAAISGAGRAGPVGGGSIGGSSGGGSAVSHASAPSGGGGGMAAAAHSSAPSAGAASTAVHH